MWSFLAVLLLLLRLRIKTMRGGCGGFAPPTTVRGGDKCLMQR
jgi:hypothetical protein